MTGQSPGPSFIVRLPMPDDGPRLPRFCDAHPGAVVERGRLGSWEIAVPDGDGIRFTARRNLGVLIDRLAELYGEW